MIRSVLAAVFLGVCVPAALSGQLVNAPEEGLRPRLRITPHVGYLVPYKRQEMWSHMAAGDIAFERVTSAVPSGVAFGLQLEATVIGPLALVTSGSVASRGGARITVESQAPLALDASRVVMARAGLALQLPGEAADLVNRRVNIAVFGGGAMLHERPGNAFGVGDLLDSATHYGFSFGATAERTFSNEHFALHVSVEDNVIRWDEAALSRVAAIYYNDAGSAATSGSSHLWLLRAGITIRL